MGQAFSPLLCALFFVGLGWLILKTNPQTCYVSVNDANCKCKDACKLYNVPYDEFLAAFRVVDSICKREGWTIDSITYIKTSDSKVSGAPGVTGTSKAGKTSSSAALASQAPTTITGGAENHTLHVRDSEFTQNWGSLGGGSKYKSNGVTLTGSPERKTSTNSVSRRRYR